MTPDQDPNFIAELASKALFGLASLVLTISLFIGGIFFRRFFKKQDDFEKRLNKLEEKSIATLTDLKQLEKKIDDQGEEMKEQGRSINSQLRQIYTLLIDMAGKK